MSFDELMRSSIPDGESGIWRVEKFTVSEADEEFGRMRMHSFTSGGRYVPAGTYTRLLMGSSVMMSDTPDELIDHFYPLSLASGTCFVTGLGLGCVVQGMLEKKKENGSSEVDKVIVIEKSEDVIKLVGVHFMDRYGKRIEIRHEDALTYKPPAGERYNIVWHDIWLDICEDNLKTMGVLHRKYCRRCEWQDSWQRRNLKRRQAERRRRDRLYRGYVI